MAQVETPADTPAEGKTDPREDLKKLPHGPKPTEPVEHDPRKSWDGQWHRIE